MPDSIGGYHPCMTADTIVRLFADPGRVRAFAAVALGSGSTDEVARAAGLSAREAAVALGRLRERGVVVGAPGSLRVHHELFQDFARDNQAPAPAEDPDIRAFVQNGRILRLPASWQRKVAVLRHVVDSAFAPGATYDERSVNDTLRAWCDGGEVDHVSVRRYLVDLGLLDRDNATSTYRVAAS